MASTDSITGSISAPVSRDTVSGVGPTRRRLVLLQSLIAIGLSYSLLFSQESLVTHEIAELFALGLLLSVVGLMALPTRFLAASWFVGTIVTCNTAMTTAVIYLSGHASLDLYLLYFLIILMGASVPTLTHMLALSLLLCAAYGVVLYLDIAATGSLSAGHLLRIPILLIMAVFYGMAAENVAKERREKTQLVAHIDVLKDAEEKLRKSRDELEQRVQELTVQRDRVHDELRTDLTERKRLEEQLRNVPRLESAARLAGGIAEGFDDLLCAVAETCSHLLANLGRDDPMRPHVEELFKTGDHVATLTFQLRGFCRKLTAEPKVVALNTVVADVENAAQRLLGKNIMLRLWLDPKAGSIRIDPGQLDELILTLVSNARDAMPQGGALTIETKNAHLDEYYIRHHAGARPGPYVMLAVTDTGDGIAWEDQAHIFEPFFSTKEKGTRTELGLATVYGIVKQNSGYIDLESTLGQGTSFKIYFPRLKTTAEPTVTPVRPGKAGEIEQEHWDFEPVAETILVIENEDAVRLSARETLVQHGYRSLEAMSDDEALRLAEKPGASIQLAVINLLLPGIGSREVARRLKDLLPSLRVLYMSAYPDEAVRRVGIVPPYYLRKPFTPGGLVRQVRTVLETR